MYYAWAEEYNKSPKSAGNINPPRMLDSDRVKHCGLKNFYLVACNSDASLYSLTNSPERLHGGLWYFQLPQLYTQAKKLGVLHRIVVVGSDASYEDDVAIALNGQELLCLPSFHEVDFEGVRDRVANGKVDPKRKNKNVTYGYSKEGFDKEFNEDGLFAPTLLKKGQKDPLIGSQYLSLSNLILEFDPDQKQFDRSTKLFHSRNKYAQLALGATGHPTPDCAGNIIENFSEICNTLDLTRLEETKHEPPCTAHFDDGNSTMDGFSSFFVVSKTEYDQRSGMVVRLAISGYNKGSVDHLMMQKAIADRVHSLVGDGTSSSTVVSNVCSRLADQSQCYYRARRPRGDLFTADAHPNISVFDSL